DAVNSGVWFGHSGTLKNAGGIRATGTVATGVRLDGGGTVINSGTISAADGTAVAFGGSGGNLLVLKPGYALEGAVYGGVSATNTVELAGNVGVGLTVDYNQLGLTN